MELAAISAGSLSIINHRQGSRANLEDFQLELTNITVDTNDLRAKNRCDITLSTHLTMANLKTGEAFLDFNIRGEGQADRSTRVTEVFPHPSTLRSQSLKGPLFPVCLFSACSVAR